jgi:hypothetical protein
VWPWKADFALLTSSNSYETFGAVRQHVLVLSSVSDEVWLEECGRSPRNAEATRNVFPEAGVEGATRSVGLLLTRRGPCHGTDWGGKIPTERCLGAATPLHHLRAHRVAIETR